MESTHTWTKATLQTYINDFIKANPFSSTRQFAEHMGVTESFIYTLANRFDIDLTELKWKKPIAYYQRRSIVLAILTDYRNKKDTTEKLCHKYGIKLRCFQRYKKEHRPYLEELGLLPKKTNPSKE